MVGTFHHVSKKHLDRYLAEFDFRFNLRKTTDGERTVEAIESVAGKRLMYSTPTKKGGSELVRDQARRLDSIAKNGDTNSGIELRPEQSPYGVRARKG